MDVLLLCSVECQTAEAIGSLDGEGIVSKGMQGGWLV